MAVWLAWDRELKTGGDCCCNFLLLVVLLEVGGVGDSLRNFFFSLIFGK